MSEGVPLEQSLFLAYVPRLLSCLLYHEEYHHGQQDAILLDFVMLSFEFPLMSYGYSFDNYTDQSSSFVLLFES